MYCQRYHIYLILEKVELEETTAYLCGNRLGIASNANGEVGGEGIKVVVQREMTEMRSKDRFYVQAGVISDDDKRRASCVLHFLCTYVPIKSIPPTKE